MATATPGPSIEFEDSEESQHETQPALATGAPAASSAFGGLRSLAGGLAALRGRAAAPAPQPSISPSPSSRMRAVDELKDRDLPPPVYTLPELTRLPLLLSWCATFFNFVGFALAIPAFFVPWYTVSFSSVDTARPQVTTSVSLSLVNVLYTCTCPTCWAPPPSQQLPNDCFPNQLSSFPAFLQYWFDTFNPNSPYPPGGVDAVFAAVAFVALGMFFSLAASFSLAQEIAATRAVLDLPPWRRLLCHLLPEAKWTGTAVASQALCATAFSCSLMGCIIGWTAVPAFSRTLTGINTLIFWGAGTPVPVTPAAGSTLAAVLCAAHFVAMMCEVQRKFFLRRVAREDPGNKCAWKQSPPPHTHTIAPSPHHTQLFARLTHPPHTLPHAVDPMLKLCGGAHDATGWCA